MTRRTAVTPPRDYAAKKKRLAFKAHDGHHASGYVQSKALPHALRDAKIKDGLTLDAFAQAHVDELTLPLLTRIQTLNRQLAAHIVRLEQGRL